MKRNWTVTYPRDLVAAAAERGLQTATIALGKGLVVQGLVDTKAAALLLEMMEGLKDVTQKLLVEDAQALKPYAQALAEASKIIDEGTEAGLGHPPPPKPPPPPRKKPGPKPGTKRRKAA